VRVFTKMPTYEYECLDCKVRFEEFQRMSDPPVKKCPKCGGRVRRIISGGAGLIFKGTGFYATDYKKSGTNGTGKKPLLKKTDEKSAPAKDKKEEKKIGGGEKAEKGSKKSEDGKMESVKTSSEKKQDKADK
jgi:putative FmdB family regulatory protein